MDPTIILTQGLITKSQLLLGLALQTLTSIQGEGSSAQSITNALNALVNALQNLPKK